MGTAWYLGSDLAMWSAAWAEAVTSVFPPGPVMKPYARVWFRLLEGWKQWRDIITILKIFCKAQILAITILQYYCTSMMSDDVHSHSPTHSAHTKLRKCISRHYFIIITLIFLIKADLEHFWKHYNSWNSLIISSCWIIPFDNHLHKILEQTQVLVLMNAAADAAAAQLHCWRCDLHHCWVMWLM